MNPRTTGTKGVEDRIHGWVAVPVCERVRAQIRTPQMRIRGWGPSPKQTQFHVFERTRVPDVRLDSRSAFRENQPKVNVYEKVWGYTRSRAGKRMRTRSNLESQLHRRVRIRVYQWCRFLAWGPIRDLVYEEINRS